MKDPKILLGRISAVFNATCFLLALYMTVQIIGRYQKDENSTAVAHKQFGITFEDKSPTFSVCFEGDRMYHFNQSAIYTAYGIHLTDYNLMLNGKDAFRYIYDLSSRKYSKSFLPPEFKPNVSFGEQDLFQLPNLVESVSLISENLNKSLFCTK